MHCGVLERKSFKKVGIKPNENCILCIAEMWSLWDETPGVHLPLFLKDLCQGLTVLYLEKNMLGALLLVYHLADTFIQRVHLLQGPSTWRSLGLSILLKGAIMIIYELLLVGFTPTNFYLSPYNRSAAFWLLRLPTKFLV